MVYLYGRGTGMAQLARALGISVCWPLTSPMRRRDRRNITDPYINWGCGRLPTPKNAWPSILNYDINVARSKTRTFEALAVAEVPHPRWSRDFSRLREGLGSKRSILQRTDEGTRGRGITLIPPGRKPEQTGSQYFYVERLSHQREIRIHVWLGKIIASQVKVLPPGNDDFIHSHDRGATFSTNWERWLSKGLMKRAQDIAANAVAAVGLDFGAVDLMLTKRDKLYVLEVNSAPGIQSDPTRDAYRRVLEPMIKRRAR